METTYHVWNEHTLLYKKAGDIFYIVLAGNILNPHFPSKALISLS